MREYLEKLNSRYVKGYQIFTETVEKHSLHILWYGFLISLVTRLIFWNYYNFLTEDAIELARITAGSTSGQAPLFDLVWPPLYIFISSLFFKITSNAVLSVKLVAIISGSLLIFPVFYFVKRISSRYIAALTIVLFTLNSTLLDYSIDVNTNILFTLFVFLYLVIYAKFLIKPNVRSGVLLSLAAAAAYLTRTEGIFLFFWTILLFIYMVIKKRMSSFYHLWLYSVFVLIFFTLTIPYLGFLNDVSGRMSVGARQYHFTFFPKAEGDYALMKNKLARSGREIVEGELFRDRKDLNMKKLIRRYGRNIVHIAKRVRGKFIKNDLILLSIFFGVLI
ncbi:glycosyltransferase family 39 protein, partial [bacterium]|nr:glycosyltransferase family 39 protein [bacterium]